MIDITTDIEIFKRFHKDEKENTPAWFNAGASSWSRTEKDFVDFCLNCDKVYVINDVALLYVENADGNANIHFSVLRGSQVDIEDLLTIRDELLKDYKGIFGWCSTHNWGLKRLLRACGLEFSGITMLKGCVRDRILQWQLFSLSLRKNLLN